MTTMLKEIKIRPTNTHTQMRKKIQTAPRTCRKILNQKIRQLMKYVNDPIDFRDVDEDLHKNQNQYLQQKKKRWVETTRQIGRVLTSRFH